MKILRTAESAYKGAVVGMFIFLITFGFTWLQLPWLYPAEINPLATRTNANAFSTMSTSSSVPLHSQLL